MDLGDMVTLLNTGWTLYQIYKELREQSKPEDAEPKNPKPEGKRRKRKPKGKRRK